MLIDEAKLRGLGWLNDMNIATLWSVWADTGEPYPIRAYIIWDGDLWWEFNETEHFQREIWIGFDRSDRELETATILEMEIYKQKDGKYGVYIDGKYVKTINKPSEEELEGMFWDAVIEKLKGIVSDINTFIRWTKENALYDYPLYTTRGEAVKYGLAVKAIIGMAKDVEHLGLLPDGEDWMDVMHDIGML